MIFRHFAGIVVVVVVVVVVVEVVAVLEGCQGKLPLVAFELYDFQTSHWHSLPDISTKRVW